MLAVLALATGHRREVTAITYVLAAVFLLHFLEPVIVKLFWRWSIQLRIPRTRDGR